jgi:PAS domain S-box-containing protein
MVVSSSADARQASDKDTRWPHIAARDGAAPGPDSTARFQLMIEHDADVICVVDADLRVVYANPTARATLGIAERQQWHRRGGETNHVHPEDLRHMERAVITARSMCRCSTTDARIEMPSSG